jgi:hypothetical protein
VPLFGGKSNVYAGVGVGAMKRLNSIIGMADFPATEWSSQEETKKYGLGQVRTPAKFFQTFGIHVEKQTVEQHLCPFVGKPMMCVFSPALRENHMGLDYDEIDYVFVDLAPAEKHKF